MSLPLETLPVAHSGTDFPSLVWRQSWPLPRKQMHALCPSIPCSNLCFSAHPPLKKWRRETGPARWQSTEKKKIEWPTAHRTTLQTAAALAKQKPPKPHFSMINSHRLPPHPLLPLDLPISPVPSHPIPTSAFLPRRFSYLVFLCPSLPPSSANSKASRQKVHIPHFIPTFPVRSA